MNLLYKIFQMSLYAQKIKLTNFSIHFIKREFGAYFIMLKKMKYLKLLRVINKQIFSFG